MKHAIFYALGYRRSPGRGRQSIQQLVVIRCQPEPTANGSSILNPERVLESSASHDGLPSRLRQLVSGSALVGFDLRNVLAELGLPPSGEASWIDLLDLGSLALPGLPAYSEASIRYALELAPAPADDLEGAAVSGAEVYLALRAAIDALDLDTLMHVNRLAGPFDWPYKRIFAQAEREKMQRFFASPPSGQSLLGPALSPVTPIARPREPLVPTEQRRALKVDHLEGELRDGSALSRKLPGFEQRPEQQAMARAVAEAFNRQQTLLVEAGTGTGKSLAYLLPAVRFASANNRRIVVSTNTINLQDQLFHKDVPDIQRATGLPFRATMLKGRTNYLCLRRWYALLRSEELEPHERSLLIKTLLWVPRTNTGDRAELRLVGREEEAWGRICALAETCTPLHCQYHRAGLCYLARARRAAEESHLIIVNHALLLADIVSKSKVLPDYEHLVIDEAHHLEQEATAQLGWHTSHRELAARLNLLAEPADLPSAGLVPEVFRLLARSAPRSKSNRQTDRSLPVEEQVHFAVQRARQGLDHLFSLLTRVLAERGQRTEGQVNVRISSSLRAQPSWAEVEIAWSEVATCIQHLLAQLTELEQALEELVSGDVETWEDVTAELVAQLTFWDEAQRRLSTMLLEHEPDLVSWLSAGKNEDIYLNAAPLHVGPLLHQGLFRSKQTVVLTSATLSTNGHFGYVKERLGLQEAEELLLGSPFDYQKAALVYLPTDVPEPTQLGYQERVQLAVESVGRVLDGRCLVLFTSYAQLRATYSAVREPLAQAEITLLAQGQDGASRAALLDAFKADQRTVLLGTASFWEGVDVVGDALSCVIMPRLPFSVPTDPIVEARSEAFDDPFGEYAVPQAILRFKQGFGRLIRSRNDRGAVVLLDRRLDTKFYGRAFIRSLPGCTLKRGPLGDAAATIQSWLSRERATEATALPDS